MIPEWLKYKDWSGIRVKGTALVPVPTSSLHIDRAAYLATTLESPKMGTVQSYDRCGMSGGPFHFIAVQPSNLSQGSMFEFLHFLEIAAPCPELTALWNLFKAEGWFVARDNTLRDINSGVLVPGAAIRNTFTPLEGKVPKAVGPQRAQAEKWALAFSNLFSAPVTFKAQQEFAAKYLVNGQKAFEASFYAPYEVVSLRPARDNTAVANTDAVISMQTDLALCVYHAHSVNAPAPAVKCLRTLLSEFPNHPGKFSNEAAAYLIWLLGTNTYGNWRDDKDGGNRYDHTRTSAMQSGLWPKEFFLPGDQCIMPVDLPNTRPANTRPLVV